jgi:hypothetical protein
MVGPQAFFTSPRKEFVMSAQLREIEQSLNGSKRLSEVLGDDWEHGIRDLQVKCHPDRHPDDPDGANKLFHRVMEIYDRIMAPELIKSPKRTYELCGLMAAGDVADLHFGVSTEGIEEYEYVVKVSRVPGAHVMLDAERAALSAIHQAAGDTVYRTYFPLLVDSFPAKDRIQKRVNVFAHEPGFHPLTWVLVKHGFLDGRHIGWMFHRILQALGFAHLQGYVHGAINPDHILVDVANHGIVLCGWGQSVEIGRPIKFASKRFSGLYPGEVRGKRPATQETDIFMAASLMRMAGQGQDIPDRLERFISSCIIASQLGRPKDAFELHDKLSECLEGVYGKPKFVELAM